MHPVRRIAMTVEPRARFEVLSGSRDCGNRRVATGGRRHSRRIDMGKIIGWAVLIIFLIGLLVVLGFFKLIIPG
ncbi:hypothetical protein SVA_2821 [Sulfurifustis variabilis]|uniref:Uncharacterized protein n=1 Tax=Sulfurifustis variabilis TaxID=1675686 RepID=A0A1B4V752_9GAMM|nr:hypothetical protein SVA_2821 [Sulfurifustis variabilis]